MKYNNKNRVFNYAIVRGLLFGLIRDMDGDLSSSSDEIPDHRRLPQWFTNLLKKIETTLKLPDHGRLVRLFYFSQSYPEDCFRQKRYSVLPLISPGKLIMPKWIGTSNQISWQKYRCESLPRLSPVLFFNG
jgi:hypothetical protein